MAAVTCSRCWPGGFSGADRRPRPGAGWSSPGPGARPRWPSGSGRSECAGWRRSACRPRCCRCEVRWASAAAASSSAAWRARGRPARADPAVQGSAGCRRCGFRPAAASHLARARLRHDSYATLITARNKAAPRSVVSQPNAAQLAITVSQKTHWNSCLLDLCRSSRCAASAPGQPPTRAKRWSVLSRVRQCPFRAADLSHQ